MWCQCHPQNRKYITYRNADRSGPSQHEQKIGWSSAVWFSRYTTDKQTDRQTRSSQHFPLIQRQSKSALKCFKARHKLNVKRLHLRLSVDCIMLMLTSTEYGSESLWSRTKIRVLKDALDAVRGMHGLATTMTTTTPVKLQTLHVRSHRLSGRVHIIHLISFHLIWPRYSPTVCT